MPHPIFGPPEHRLETVHAKLLLPSNRNGFITKLTVSGESSTTRKSLWTWQETWERHEQRRELEPTDALHWLALAAAQDRPNSQDALDRAIMPGGWADVPLPF